MKHFLLPIISLFLLTACPGQIKVQPTDVALTLVEMEINANSIPGAPQVDADGCMLIVRNAALLDDPDSVLKTLYMETGDCRVGNKETQPATGLTPSNQQGTPSQ